MKKQLPVSLTPFEWKAGWCYWLLQLFVLPVVLVLLNDCLPQPLSDGKLNFLFYCLNFIAMTVLLWKFLTASLQQALVKPWYMLQSAGLGLGVYLLASEAVALLIGYLKPEGFLNLNDDTISQMVRDDFALIAVGTILLVPVAEELIFRGVIFGSLYNRSRLAAYAVSSVLFAAVHLLGYVTEYDPVSLLLAFLQYLPAGVCLAWAYARSGTIAAPILIHITVNQLAIVSMR